MAPQDGVSDDLALRPRFAWKLRDESPKPRPRQRRVAEVEDVDAPLVEQVGFEGFCVFIEEPQKPDYSGIVSPKPPSMIDPSAR